MIGRSGRRPQDYFLRGTRPVRKPRSPWVVLISGCSSITAVGTVLLALPIATADGQHTTLLDALFTATSAASTTGLVLSDTATHWSPFGQVVILGLMQLGGFAFMTGSTIFLLLLVGRRTSLSDRLRVQAAGGVPQLGNVTDLVRRVAMFTLICEAAGALVLAAAFLLRGEDPATAAWWGVFHSISAFNNGGFDLFGELRSLTHLADAPTILVPIGTLIVLGGLGFAIVGDVWAKRRWVRLALETKLVLLGTVILIAVGALGTAVFEWTNPATLGRLDPADRVVNAALPLGQPAQRRVRFDRRRVARGRVAVPRHRPDVHRRRERLDGRRHQDQHGGGAARRVVVGRAQRSVRDRIRPAASRTSSSTAASRSSSSASRARSPLRSRSS